MCVYSLILIVLMCCVMSVFCVGGVIWIVMLVLCLSMFWMWLVGISLIMSFGWLCCNCVSIGGSILMVIMLLVEICMMLCMLVLWLVVVCLNVVVVLCNVFVWLCSVSVVLVGSRFDGECVNSVWLNVVLSVVIWWLVVGWVMLRVCVVLDSEFFVSIVRKVW